MKKIFTLIAALAATASTFAQHGNMTFAGKSVFYVSAGAAQMGKTEVISDTVRYSGEDITLPQMKYNQMIIPSFTIKGAQYTGGHDGVTWADQTFTATAGEKQINGTSFSGTFTHTGGVYKLSIQATFNYGSMPMPITYTIESYYVKSETKPVSVTVGGQFGPYTNDAVTYDARVYEEDGAKKMDVTMNEYNLNGTVMGDILLGTYTVNGLIWDEEKGGYFRDYSKDDIKFRFKTSTGMDGEYTFKNGGALLVVMDGASIKYAENTFQPGSMPFPIVATFGDKEASGIELPQTSADKSAAVKKTIVNGRLVIERDGRKFNASGIEIK